MYRCVKCNSDKVESKTWVGINNGIVGEFVGGCDEEEDNWCSGCGSHCIVIEDNIKEFLCIQLSENRNSFGLRQMTLLARDGTAVQACANDRHILEENQTVMSTGYLQFANFELVEKTESTTEVVVNKIWRYKDEKKDK